MQQKECIAMILAGGQGTRLGALTQKLAKPAVPFGGKYRIIDFTLSNCCNSGIDTVGVLTQYEPLALHSYIGIGSPWDLDGKDGGVFVLPPFVREKGGEWYEGTAHAIYQNIQFVDMFNPQYIVVLSGDHIYKMDYAQMLAFHKAKGAEATIAVIEIPWEEAHRFGIMHTTKSGAIEEFAEKPPNPKNNLASMGVYIFNWPLLKRYLQEDAECADSSHDFGKNVIPKMLADGRAMYAYPFKGYWKDVGTIDSFWEANMDLLANDPKLNLYDPQWPIYSVNQARPPQFVAATAKVTRSMVSQGCLIFGEVDNSVIFPGVYIGEGAVVRDSVILPFAHIGGNTHIDKAIIGRKVFVAAGCQIGHSQTGSPKRICMIPEGLVITPLNAIVANGNTLKPGSEEKQAATSAEAAGGVTELIPRVC